MTKNSSPKELEDTLIQIVKEKNPQTVKQLVSLAKERLPFPEEEILEHVLRMQSEGKLSLTKPPATAPLTLAAYLGTEDALWYWATIVMVMATVVAVFTIPEDSFPLVFVRYVLGSFFVLWLPGYSFVRALFPQGYNGKMDKKNMDTVERIALSLGMSLALVPIIGLLLNYTPWGIRVTPIVLSLVALTMVFSTVAVIREHQIKTKAAG